MFLKSKLPVTSISADRLDRLVESAELIVADLNGPKVMRLANGNMIKLFRRKRLVSSAAFAPYAIRFVNNAFRLRELDIPTIKPLAILYCAQSNIHVVEYEPLEGYLLRGLLKQQEHEDLFAQTARFIAKLHRKGIYFRSLHFENIISHHGKLGLIDVADMKIYPGHLRVSLGRRNFQHFLRYPMDAELIHKFGHDRFLRIYDQALIA